MLLGIEASNGGPVSHQGRRHRRLLGDSPAALTRAHLDLYGIELVLVPGPCALFTGRGLELARERAGLCLLRNPSRPRRYALASSVRRVETEEEMLERVERDPSGPVPVLAPADLAPPLPAEDGAAGGVEVIEYRPGHVRLRVDARRPGTLIVRESWSRGWRARVDGADAPLHPAAGLFFAVPLASGRHAVELRYTTPGRAAGVAGLAAWAGLVATAWAQRGRTLR
jgi:hypothetical protein